MGGKVPAEDMHPDRTKLLEDARRIAGETSMRQYDIRSLLRDLAVAAGECPRMSCAYCEHQARSEAQKQAQGHVGEAEAG